MTFSAKIMHLRTRSVTLCGVCVTVDPGSPHGQHPPPRESNFEKTTNGTTKNKALHARARYLYFEGQTVGTVSISMPHPQVDKNAMEMQNAMQSNFERERERDRQREREKERERECVCVCACVCVCV